MGFIWTVIFLEISGFREDICDKRVSVRLRWHDVSLVVDYADAGLNYFTLEKVKIQMKKVSKNIIWYFQKLCVHIDYADTVLALLLTIQTHAQIVIDYADMMLA